MKRTVLALLLLVAFAPSQAFGAGSASVDAELDRSTVALGETLTYTLSISSDVDSQPSQLKLPDFRGFDNLGRSQSEQISMSLGTGGRGFRRVKNISVTLSPLKTGQLEIGPAAVVIAGKKYETRPMTVTVLPAGKASPQPQQRQGQQQQPGARFPSWDQDFDFDSIFGKGRQIGKDDLILRAGVDKNSLYVGEQAVYVVQIMSQVPLRGIDAMELPKFEGFWTEDIASSQRITGESKVVNGVTYNIYVLKRKAIFPLKPGTFRLSPASVQISIGTSMFSPGQRLNRAGEPVEITVKPLPDEGKPQGFNPENVGQFTFKGELSSTQTTTDQPITVKYTVAGTGNIKSVQIPRLKTDDFKVYDPTVTDSVNTTRFRYAGERYWEYLLVPKKPGRFTLPVLTFNYFDPSTGRYSGIDSQPLSVDVTQGTGGGPSALIGGGGAQGQDPAVGGLKPIRYTGVLVPSTGPVFLKWWFRLLFVLFPLAYFGHIAWDLTRAALTKQTPQSRQRKALAAASKRLKAAGGMLKAGKPAPDSFFLELSRAIQGYLSDRMGIEPSGLTIDGLRGAMRARGTDEGLIERTAAGLETCDLARFAPGTYGPEEMARELDNVRRLLLDLERNR